MSLPTGDDRLARGLSSIRWRRRVTWIAFWTYIPGVWLGWAATHSKTAVGIAIGAWMIAYAVGGMLISLAKCPRCRERFHLIPFRYANPWTRRCLHCGLALC
jgi:hypothetical protein